VPKTDTVLNRRKRRLSLRINALVGTKKLLVLAMAFVLCAALLASCGGGGSSGGGTTQGGTTTKGGATTKEKTIGPKTTATPGGATTKETTIQRTVPKQ
jgi:hypothetical protein